MEYAHEWTMHWVFDGSCGSTIAANFRPLTFGRLLAQVLVAPPVFCGLALDLLRRRGLVSELVIPDDADDEQDDEKDGNRLPDSNREFLYARRFRLARREYSDIGLPAFVSC